MEKKEILKTTMNQLPPFEAKIRRLVIIENLKISSECYRNWINGVNVPSRKKQLVINEIIGKPIYT